MDLSAPWFLSFPDLILAFTSVRVVIIKVFATISMAMEIVVLAGELTFAVRMVDPMAV